jgi:cobalamin transport system substrate-binding protein
MSEGTRRIPRLLAATLAVLALVAAACGSSGSSKTGAEAKTSASASFPLTVRAANGAVAVPKKPTRIVSLSPTATEMLFAVGAGKQVVAVDDTSNYPRGVPKTSLSALNPNIEAIAGYRPDLVVAANDTGGLLDNLKRLSIPTLLEPAAKTLDDSYSQITQLGTATGHRPAAVALAARMREQVADLVKQVPKRAAPLTYYYELDSTLFTVTSDTFIGQVYKLAGLHNIADATADKAGGYPQLSAEFVVQSNPNLIFLADTKCCSQTAATVAARPGWSGLRAVKDGHVVLLDDDVAQRWGPRVVDYLKIVIDSVKRASG